MWFQRSLEHILWTARKADGDFLGEIAEQQKLVTILTNRQNSLDVS